MTNQTLVRLKLLAALVALACGVAAIVTVYELYQATPPALSVPPARPAAAQPTPTPAPTPASTPARMSFPSPPRDALALAQEDRDLAVGLAVSQKSGRVALQASVVGQEQPAEGLDVAFRMPGRAPVHTDVCGPGCYRAEVPAPAPRVVAATIRGNGRQASTVTFALPASVPGQSAAALVHKAERTWRSLRSLVVHDHLASGPGNAITAVWQMAAPDRETYAIRNGPQAVVIGDRRWDRLPGHGWQPSQQDPIHAPVPLWEAVSNARLVGTSTLHGRPISEITFFDPQIQAWFRIWVDRGTGRTLELRMTAQAHFMHQVYGPFDRPLRIAPPVAAP